MYREYKRHCPTGRFGLGDIFVWDSGDRVVYNLGTQPRPGPSASLEAIQRSVSAALFDAAQRGIERLGVPRIGAGLGGLAWEAVREVLDDAGQHGHVELVVVTLPAPQT